MLRSSAVLCLAGMLEPLRYIELFIVLTQEIDSLNKSREYRLYAARINILALVLVVEIGPLTPDGGTKR